MFIFLFYSILGVLGFGFVYYYAVSALPYLVILSVFSALAYGAWFCGDLTSAVMMLLLGLLLLGVGFFYIRELVHFSTAKQVAYFGPIKE